MYVGLRALARLFKIRVFFGQRHGNFRALNMEQPSNATVDDVNRA